MIGRSRMNHFNFAPEMGWRNRIGLPIVEWKDLGRRSISKRSQDTGTVAGLSAARGEHHSDLIGELPARQELVHASQERQVCVERNADSHRTHFELQKAGLESKRDNASRVRDSKQKFLDEIPAPRPEDNSERHIRLGTGAGLAYFFILILLAAVEWPTVWASLEYAPFEEPLKYVLTTGLATAISMSAHVIAEYAWAVIEARNDERRLASQLSSGTLSPAAAAEGKASDQLEIRLKATLAVGLFVAMLSLMVFMFLSRGESFAKVAEKTKGGVFSDAGLLSGTLLALQVVLFLVALGMGIVRAKGKKEREAASNARKIRATRLRAARKLERRRRRAERAVKKATHREHKYTTQIEAIDTRLEAVEGARERWLAQEDAYLQRMLADHDFQYEDAEHSSVVLYREERNSASIDSGAGAAKSRWQQIWPVLGWAMFGATVLALILTGGN